MESFGASFLFAGVQESREKYLNSALNVWPSAIIKCSLCLESAIESVSKSNKDFLVIVALKMH
jgi:hypothetical protein